MPTAASMQTRFPESFADTATAVLDAAIAEAARLHDAGALGALYEDAVLYYAAYLATSGRRAQGDGIASAAAGGVNVSFANGAGNDAASSAYLAAYHRVLQQRRPFGVLLSMVPGL